MIHQTGFLVADLLGRHLLRLWVAHSWQGVILFLLSFVNSTTPRSQLPARLSSEPTVHLHLVFMSLYHCGTSASSLRESRVHGATGDPDLSPGLRWHRRPTTLTLSVVQFCNSRKHALTISVEVGEALLVKRRPTRATWPLMAI